MVSAISITDCGAREPWIVMVHGMSQDHRVFDRQVAAFRGTYNLLLVDLPGHGLAKGVGGPFGHNELAAHVAGCIRQHKLSRVHYWGTHTGAAVGLLLAATEPELIGSLILEGPVVPGRNPSVVVDLMARTRAEMLARGVARARVVWWEQSSWFDYMRAHPEACRAGAQRDIVEDFGGAPWSSDAVPSPVTDAEEKLAAISCPALIYNGAFDHPDFLAAADVIAGLVGSATRIRIPDAGGFPAWERPYLVNGEVASFLSGMGRPT